MSRADAAPSSRPRPAMSHNQYWTAKLVRVPAIARAKPAPKRGRPRRDDMPNAAQARLSPMQLLAIRCGRMALIAQIGAFAPDNAARLVGIAIVELFSDFVRVTPAADQILGLVNGRLAKA